MKTWQMYVEGKWIHAEGARTYSLPNPASEEEIALAPNASVADVGRAVAAARRAFDEATLLVLHTTVTTLLPPPFLHPHHHHHHLS